MNNLGKAAKKLYGLDHLRALAIILVFLYHYGRLFPHPQWVNDICKFGWTGVDLFFVLSGYLIAAQLFQTIAANQPLGLKTFFIKRFFRIIPAYLVVVIIYFSFPFVKERGDTAPLWKFLTFTQNLGLDLRTQGSFSHAWSLCIEEQFYLFLPFILSLLVYYKAIRKGYLLLAFLFVTGFLIRLYAYKTLPAPDSSDFAMLWMKRVYYPTYCRLDGLLAGVGIAALFQFRPFIKEWVAKHANKFLLLSLALLTGAYFLCVAQQSFGATVFGFPLVSIGYGLLVMAAISPSCVLYRFPSTITSHIAVLSYAMYLVHKFVIFVTQNLLEKAGMEKDSNLMFFVCIAVVTMIAWIVNRLVERPFTKLRNNLLAPAKKAEVKMYA